MAGTILLVRGNYHLGDNPGIFQHAAYVGYQLVLPVRKTWMEADAESVQFHFCTHDIETWGNWKGHKVSINHREVGRIKDQGNAVGDLETTVIDIRKEQFVKLLDGSDNFLLSVELEKQPAFPGMSDDFVLTRIASSSNLAIALGWKPPAANL